MRRAQEYLDTTNPWLSARLRLLQKRLRHDMTLRLIEQLVRRGDNAVDVGAHRGTYTLALAARVGRGGHVWSMEPFPPSASALERMKGRRRNITVCPVAASDRNGRRHLSVPVYRGHRLGALSTLGAPPPVASTTFDVDVRTVDDLLGGVDLAARPVTFLRCDVVGHEYEVLAGASRTLTSCRPSLLVEIEQRHQERPVEETFDRLASLGYRGFFLDGQDLRPLADFDVERHQLALVPNTFVPYDMPEGYVHYFLFVTPERERALTLTP
jgi:FkbM family methyltransferase